MTLPEGVTRRVVTETMCWNALEEIEDSERQDLYVSKTTYSE